MAKVPLPFAFGTENPFEFAHSIGSAQTGEREGTPRDAQRNAERGFIGTVAGDVADHDVHRPVRGLDEIVEIAAEQRVLPTRDIPRDDLDAGVVQQQWGRREAALEAGVLPCPELAGVQLDGGELRSFPLDRVQHRAPQHLRFDPALDQVVLSARSDRRHAEVLVVQPREHHDRQVWVGGLDAFEGGDAVGVGQVEIQQHAVRPGQHQLAFGVCHRLCPDAVDVGGGVSDEFLDQDRVAPVVLHQQDGQPLLSLGANRSGVRHRRQLGIDGRAHG